MIAAIPGNTLFAQDEWEQGEGRETPRYSVFVQVGSALLPCARERGPSLGLESNIQTKRQIYIGGALNAAYIHKPFLAPVSATDEVVEFVHKERCFTADLNWGYNFFRPNAQQTLMLGAGVSGAIIQYEYVPNITYLASGELLLSGFEHLNFLAGYYRLQASYDYAITPHIQAGAKAVYRFSFDELPEIERTETRFGPFSTSRSRWGNTPSYMWELSLRLGFVF